MGTYGTAKELLPVIMKNNWETKNFLANVPCEFISAKKKTRIFKGIEIALEVYEIDGERRYLPTNK